MSTTTLPSGYQTAEDQCLDCHEIKECTFFKMDGRKLFGPLCANCRQARDEAAERRKREEEEQERLLRIRDMEKAWTALCPSEFRLPSEKNGCTDLVRLDKEQPRWREVLGWQYGPRGLLIRGSTGVCKTRISWRLLRRLHEEGKSIAAMTAARFDRECRDAGGNFTLTEWFNDLARVSVLFVDDLGKGAWTQATEAQFFDLVDERTREGRPIILTSNDTGESLASRLSPDRAEPLIRRIRNFCQCIVLT